MAEGLFRVEIKRNNGEWSKNRSFKRKGYAVKVAKGIVDHYLNTNACGYRIVDADGNIVAEG